MPAANDIASILWSAEKSGPDRPALIQAGAELRYGQLAAATRRLAGYLADHGIERGEVVALLMSNCQQFVVAHYALAALGATVAPLIPQWRGDLLLHALEKSGTRHVVTLAGLLDRVPRATGATARLETVTLIDGGPEPAAPLTVRTLTGQGAGNEPAIPLATLADKPATTPVAPGDPAVLFMTSGTTGDPKGILLNHHQVLLGLDAWATRWNFSSQTRSLMVAPFSHVVYNPLVLGAHRRGGTSIVLTTLSPRAAAVEVERSGATAIMGTPSLFVHLLQDTKALAHDLRTLDTIIYGAAPSPVPMIHELRRRFPGAGLYNCYGLTETASAVSCLGSEALEGREASVGRAHAGVEISIRDAQARDVAAGETGEVCCRGPNVIRGYHDAPEVNAERFLGEWLRTGDVGYLDDEGYLYLVGRADDMINVSGEKIYPQDVENVLHRFPAVFDAAVVGMADASKGQIVRAYIVPRDDADLDLAQLKRFCIRNLPAAFVPRSFQLVDRLPRNPSGKILRRELTT